MLTLPVPCISGSCTEIKMKLNFYFHTSLWCLKRFYEGLNKGLHKTFSGTTKQCKNKNLTSELNFWKIRVIRTLSVIFAYWFISMVVLTYDNAVWRKIFQKSTDALKTNNKISSNHLCHIIQAKNSWVLFESYRFSKTVIGGTL